MDWVSGLDMGNVDERVIRAHCDDLIESNKNILDELMRRISDECGDTILLKATKGGKPFAIHVNLREGGRPKVMAAIYIQKRTGIKVYSRKMLKGFIKGKDRELPYVRNGIRSSDIPIVIQYLKGQ